MAPDEEIRQRRARPGLALAFEPVQVRGEGVRRWFRGLLGPIRSPPRCARLSVNRGRPV